MPASANGNHLDAPRVEAIRHLNDDLRVHGRGGRVVVTDGFADLPATTQALAFRAVRAFNAFTHDNDPYREHDCAAVTVGCTKLIWKIDCFDRSLTAHSPNPADPKVTQRVLTIMLADED